LVRCHFVRRTCTTVPCGRTRPLFRSAVALLSIGKLAAGAGDYYTAMVADGAEEYFTSAREAPGVWVGQASQRLGLAGTVQPDDFASVLDHQYPGTNVRITAARSAPSVAGFDATFCAPKSVSILHGLGTPDIRAAVRQAHDVAVREALAVFESAASRGRRGHGGADVIDGDGFVAAAFAHRTSRAGDPHLHTHVVIANLVHGPDGRWTALDARPLYHWSKTVGYLYEAELRHQLTRTVGVEWRTVRRGIADVAEVPMQVVDEFSTRRHEIEAHLAENGFDSARSAQLAAYATRRMKDHTATPESLVDTWQRRASELGFDCEQVCDRLNAGTLTLRWTGLVHLTPMFEHLAGPDGLTKTRSTFGRREVIQGICDRLPIGAPVADICEWADLFIDSEHCTRLAGTKSAVIRTSDGRTVSARTDERRFSTPDMLTTERRLIAAAVGCADAGVGLADPQVVDVAIGQRPSMSDEQVEMVRQLCTSGRGVDLVEGVAGAGKTFALAAANQAWTESGHTVIGCALAAKAARQLQTDADIPSRTIDRLLIDLDRPERGGLAPNTVIVVDEAAMVGTRKVLRLLDHARQADAKVVLVGDPCQLPEIEAGGAFVGLRQRLSASYLADNRRQREPWERAALARLRTGDTDTAIDTYIERGRVEVAPTGAEARSRMIGDWLDARRTGTAVMLASRRVDVDALNRYARRALRKDGALGADKIIIAGHGYTEGDIVVALRNDRRLGLLNGTRATVDAIDTHAQVMRCRADDDQAVTIPFDYAADGHLTHGYATTIHKSQGATYDRCLILAGDHLTKESAYTAMSRGRIDNTLYLVDDGDRATDSHTNEIESSLVDRVRSSISRTAAQSMAVDQTPASHDDDLDFEIDL
jgi:conjugative relaxase-like TrwC/TraI family protein